MTTVLLAVAGVWLALAVLVVAVLAAAARAGQALDEARADADLDAWWPR